MDTYMDFSTMDCSVQRAARFRTPNPHEVHCGLWVDRIGWMRESSATPFTRGLRILGLYGVVAVEEGQGRLCSARFGEAGVEAGDVIVLLPEDAVTYGPTGSGWRQRWVVWGGPAATDLARWTGYSSMAPVVRGAAEDVSRAFAQLHERMSDESTAAAIERDATLRHLVARMLAVARRVGLSESQSNAVGRAVAFIENEFPRALTSPELARCAGLSETHFRRLFSERMGVAPRAYITARRIARAKALLAEGLRVRAVAEACGFSDEFYFMRVFKRLTGLSPGAWRSANMP